MGTLGNLLQPAIYALSAAIVVASLACASKSAPFAVGDRPDLGGTSTPRPAGVLAPAAGAVSVETASPDDIPSKGTIRLVEWEDNNIQLINFIAGYIIVFGYLYNVDVVQATSTTPHDALLAGLADAQLDLNRAELASWYDSAISGGKVADLGAIYESSPERRIVISTRFKQEAPDVVEFLSKVVPGDAAFASIAAQISTGRTAIRPNVAGIIFLKEYEAVWSQWVSEEVRAAVKNAIDRGKISLCRKYFKRSDNSAWCGNT